MANAGGREVGRVSIRVVPKIDGFKREVESALSTLKDIKTKIDPELDKHELKRQARDAADDAKQTVDFESDLDKSSLSRQARVASMAASRFKVRFRAVLDGKLATLQAKELADRLQNIANGTALKFDPKSLSIRDSMDVTGVTAGLDKVIDRFKVLRSHYKDTDALTKYARHMKNALGTQVKLGSMGSRSFKWKTNFQSTILGLRDMNREMQRSIKPMAAFKQSFKGFASLGNVFAGVTAVVAAGAGLTSAAVIGLSYVIGGVVDGAKTLSKSLWLLPGALSVAGIAAGAAYMGFKGFGNGLKAALDPAADLEKEIADLAPAAQDSAREVRRFAEPLRIMRKAVQEVTFDGWAPQIREAGEKWLPMMVVRMGKVAQGVNSVGNGFLKWAGMDRTVTVFANMMDHTAEIMQNMGKSAQPFLSAISEVAEVGTKKLANMSDNLPNLAERFNEWASSSKGRQEISDWIDQGVQGFKDLGAAVKDFGGALQNIGHAFGVAFNGDALSRLRETSAEFRNWIGDADDANSRISRFADYATDMSRPWVDAFKRISDAIAPVKDDFMEFSSALSGELADTMATFIEDIAPSVESFFKFLNDHKDFTVPLIGGLIALRAAFGVFKIGRALAAPFINMFTGIGGVLGKTEGIFAKGGKKGGKGLGKAGKAAKEAGEEVAEAGEKAAKSSGGWTIFGGGSKKAAKAAGEAGEATGKVAKEAAKSTGKVSKLGSALSFIPGPWGKAGKAASKAGGKVGMFSKVASKMPGPVRSAGGAVAKLGPKMGKVGKVAGVAGKGLRGVGTAAKFAGKGMLRMVPGLGPILMAAEVGMMIHDNWDTIGPVVTKAKDKVVEFGQKAGNKISEGWDKGKEKVKSWGSTLKENFGRNNRKLIDGFKDKWNGLQDTLKGKNEGLDTVEAGGYFPSWDDIKGKAQSVKDKVQNFFSDTGSWFSNTWDGVKEKWSTKWGEIKEGLGTKWDEIKTNAQTTWTDASNSVSTAWDNVQTWWGTTWDTISTWIGEKWNTIKTNAQTTWQDASTTVSTAWDNVQTWWGTKWDEISNWATTKWDEIKLNAQTTWADASTTVSTAWDNVQTSWSTKWDEISTSLSEKWTTLKTNAQTTWTDASTSVGTAWDGVQNWWGTTWGGVSNTLSGWWNGIKGNATNTFSGVSGEVQGAWSNVEGSTSSTWGSVSGTVSSNAASASAAAASNMGSIMASVQGIVGPVIGAAVSAMAGFVSSIAGGFGDAVGLAASLPGRFMGALGNLGGLLVSSGIALVQGFINGIRSMIGAVASAAQSVVSAARDFFPFSPAKKGPFSGHGYTTYSGKALTKDFAGGMLSNVGTVQEAANAVASAASAPFDDFNKQQVLKPVLESNAKAIADSRKEEADAMEDYNKRMAEAGDDAEKRAEIEKEHAEKIADIRKSLTENIEEPDYSKIDRSFRKYYIEGAKGILQEKLKGVIQSQGLINQAKAGALEMVRQARGVVGDHPILAQVEYNVNAPHFEEAINQVIEDSGIAAVPIEFAISNLDQLKDDLGMGDGVISRAIDAAMDYNVNDSDANRFKDSNKSEVHYHVEDMQEAIRLENLRERKQMMKI